MMNNFEKKLEQEKITRANTYKNLKNNNFKLLYNYNINKKRSRNLNFLTNKENDINTFNILAKSKLLDINDIKNLSNNKNFYDYNYNRSYIKNFSIDENIILKNNNFIKNIRKNKNYEELIQYLNKK